MNIRKIDENGLHIVFGQDDNNHLKLLHFSSAPWDGHTGGNNWGSDPFYPVQVKITGENMPREIHGTKNSCVSPGYRLELVTFEDSRNEQGRLLTITQTDRETGLKVILRWQFCTGLPIVRCTTELINEGVRPLTVEYVTSFCLTGRDWRDEDLTLHIPFHSWCHEMTWKSFSLADLGMGQTQPEGLRRSSQFIDISNTGNWSTKKYLPMGALESRSGSSVLFWQIEHNGSWHWEMSDHDGYLYLQLSGPAEHQSHWWTTLESGMSFTSVPVAVGAVGSLPGCAAFPDHAGQVLTRYRRLIRRPNADNRDLPVIFNDYMNCLFGDPTAEKEYPMIDRAAEAGCEYYVIDAGWYADGEWWDGVGEWKESRVRFPEGLRKVTDYIRSKGMIPGLWLELEVMGINCPLASKLPDSWFFTRHGRRIVDRSRYQLDFSNPEVREHADRIINRLVEEYGAGYIKMDYNIEPGIGTTGHCESAGEGLLAHNRAYLSWLADTFRRYPDLVIENCSSGGLRMDYAMLSLYPIQSTSDNEDYRRYPVIAANAPMALTPEQAAVWSYPLAGGDIRECAFNLVSAMLLRIHQSGHLADLDETRFDLVREGLSYYKSIRHQIRDALPFWPLGLADYEDGWVCFGLHLPPETDRGHGDDLIAVWRCESEEETVELPYALPDKENADVRVVFPSGSPQKISYDKDASTIRVTLDEPYSARLLRVSMRSE